MHKGAMSEIYIYQPFEKFKGLASLKLLLGDPAVQYLLDL